MSRIPAFQQALFKALRLMDAEAVTLLASGGPTGLSDYGRHARHDLRKPQAEVEWSRRIAALLRIAGFGVQTEVPYPAYAVPVKRRRQRCDLVIDLGEEGKLWLEVKGAWRDYWGGNSGIYRCYLLFPLDPRFDLGKDHTVPFDLAKLNGLGQPEAQHVAELLIGFENLNDPMSEEIDTLIQLARLQEWQSATDTWESTVVPSQRIRVFLWHRAVQSNIDGPPEPRVAAET